jgi:hypothetical protein
VAFFDVELSCMYAYVIVCMCLYACVYELTYREYSWALREREREREMGECAERTQSQTALTRRGSWQVPWGASCNLEAVLRSVGDTDDPSIRMSFSDI